MALQGHVYVYKLLGQYTMVKNLTGGAAYHSAMPLSMSSNGSIGESHRHNSPLAYSVTSESLKT
jgi:hypothetical protein